MSLTSRLWLAVMSPVIHSFAVKNPVGTSGGCADDIKGEVLYAEYFILFWIVLDIGIIFTVLRKQLKYFKTI